MGRDQVLKCLAFSLHPFHFSRTLPLKVVAKGIFLIDRLLRKSSANLVDQRKGLKG